MSPRRGRHQVGFEPFKINQARERTKYLCWLMFKSCIHHTVYFMQLLAIDWTAARHRQGVAEKFFCKYLIGCSMPVLIRRL